MPRRKRDNFWDSAKMNNATYIQYYNILMEIGVSMFEWQNLPDTIDERFLELTLFTDGMAVFFYDDVLGYLCLQTMIGGNLNVYRIPMERTAYATNGYQNKLDNTNSVIIWNNVIRTNSMNDVEMYAKRLYNIQRAIDVNVNAQKTPVMILADESQRLTMKNLYMQYDGNEPFIFGDKGLNMNQIKALSTQAPFVADKLQELKTRLWNEALTRLGVMNVGNEKKERLISDEVSSSQGGTVAMRYTRLNMRKQACKEINKMFGLNIDVDYRADYIDELAQYNDMLGGW